MEYLLSFLIFLAALLAEIQKKTLLKWLKRRWHYTYTAWNRKMKRFLSLQKYRKFKQKTIK
ncbi:hypothetical protein DI43_16485 [Geobacillus sp. CAMR12739]|nr:hypothetical protein DI43_16485 [Geobacillus sp. CAMR12739]